MTTNIVDTVPISKETSERIDSYVDAIADKLRKGWRLVDLTKEGNLLKFKFVKD